LEADLEEIRSAAEALPPTALADEGTWTRVAQAIAHHASIYPAQAEDLYAILDEVSRRASGYDADENWHRFLRHIEGARRREDPITTGTLFHMAQSHGSPNSAPATIPSQVTAPLPADGHGSEAGSSSAFGPAIPGFGATASMRDGLNV